MVNEWRFGGLGAEALLSKSFGSMGGECDLKQACSAVILHSLSDCHLTLVDLESTSYSRSTVSDLLKSALLPGRP